MCGILGFLDRTGGATPQLGATMLAMMNALGCRGPDSAGIAVYERRTGDRLRLRVKLGERGECADRAAAVLRVVDARVAVHDRHHDHEYLRVLIDDVADIRPLLAAIEAIAPDIEVISCGHSLDVVKQVGSPQRLDERFGISRAAGTHAIAHTRLSTESRIDLSHSQPFWAHGSRDLATVHNGHITNYHKLRRQYEERGVRFYTENDSEIIGMFLAEQMDAGVTFTESLERSIDFFDGSFSYLAATQNEIGFAKDRFGFKPLIVSDEAEFVAIATEEIALRARLGEEIETWEPPPGSVRSWRSVHAGSLGTTRNQMAETGRPQSAA
jgi:methylamine---glutamate N-methyltransferase subunit A